MDSSVFDNKRENTQPSVDMVLVPRDDIEKIRRALLYLCASEARGGKGLRPEAERLFFWAHERLTELLKAVPQTVASGLNETSNTEESKQKPGMENTDGR